MDYEKKYNEALNDMRAIYPNLKGDAKLAVEHAFPELYESEDERIRKWLVDYFKSVGKSWIHRDISPEQIIAYLEKQKEQKPNIELIQRSWYMEGYHDREFGKEPKWIIKTGEGGPRHEPNPRYGQPLAKEQNPAEWSEEDEKRIQRIHDFMWKNRKGDTDTIYQIEKDADWLKSLPMKCPKLSDNWKPSEEQQEEPDKSLEEAADKHIRKVVDAAGHPGWDWTTQDIADAFIAGAKWQKERDELTWRDAMDFCVIAKGGVPQKGPGVESFYSEVLRIYKEDKKRRTET